jgi:hypothetical protein
VGDVNKILISQHYLTLLIRLGDLKGVLLIFLFHLLIF